MPETAQDIRLPKASDRTVIVGRTGSGKTQAAVWHLSMQNIDKMPWVIVDYKNDELINSIEKAVLIDYGTIPARPGIYILKVLPGEEDKIQDWFWRVWERERIGIYVDEGFMVGQHNKAFNACLTQGRSKRIPMIVLSQRPIWMSRFVWSEASFFQVFDLTDDEDMKSIKRFVKDKNGKVPTNDLPDFHSYYFDVGKKKLNVFSPVPSGDELLASIDAKLPKTRRTI